MQCRQAVTETGGMELARADPAGAIRPLEVDALRGKYSRARYGRWRARMTSAKPAGSW
jgi:hypothetical protein